jgi:hypothetical protein
MQKPVRPYSLSDQMQVGVGLDVPVGVPVERPPTTCLHKLDPALAAMESSIYFSQPPWLIRSQSIQASSSPSVQQAPRYTTNSAQ